MFDVLRDPHIPHACTHLVCCSAISATNFTRHASKCSGVTGVPNRRNSAMRFSSSSIAFRCSSSSVMPLPSPPLPICCGCVCDLKDLVMCMCVLMCVDYDSVCIMLHTTVAHGTHTVFVYRVFSPTLHLCTCVQCTQCVQCTHPQPYFFS